MSSVEAYSSVPPPSGYQAISLVDQTVLESMPTAVCVCSADGTLARFNQRAIALWGRAPRSGETHERFCGAFRVYKLDGTPLLHSGTPMETALRTGEPQRDQELMIERPDGSRVVVLMNIDVLRNDAGVIEGAVNCFQDISERKQAAEREVERRRGAEQAAQQLASIVESSEDAIVSKNLDGVIATWNKGAERLFGYTSNEVVGKSVTILIPADHRDEEPAILKRIRAGERVEHYETKRRRKDGSLIDISLTVSPVRDGSGKVVGASKIARDISERKQAEAQRDLLVAELSHRVKNTLATVVSIARQSFATNPDPVEAQRSFNARIRALGQTHSRLAEANWSGVSLETVLLDEIAPYRHADGANFRAAGPVTMLSAKHALTLGMAMHELATNAAKYGALSTENGVVDVGWQVDGEQLQITWSESGGPPVTPPKRNGFGRLLIERVLASDLEGDVRMDFARNGLKCTITVPLSIQLPTTETLNFLMPAR